jgi:hypothetical protein
VEVDILRDSGVVLRLGECADVAVLQLRLSCAATEKEMAIFAMPLATLPAVRPSPEALKGVAARSSLMERLFCRPENGTAAPAAGAMEMVKSEPSR